MVSRWSVSSWGRSASWVTRSTARGEPPTDGATRLRSPRTVSSKGSSACSGSAIRRSCRSTRRASTAHVSYTLTRNGPGDVREVLRAPEKDADRVVARAVQVARRGETSRLGRMLAPASVRYVAVALRNGPGGSAGHTPRDVARALDGQLDLARVPSSPSALVLYENESWIPTRAVVSGKRASEVPDRLSRSALEPPSASISPGAAAWRPTGARRHGAPRRSVRFRVERVGRWTDPSPRRRVRLHEQLDAAVERRRRDRSRRPGSRRAVAPARGRPVDRRARLVVPRSAHKLRARAFANRREVRPSDDARGTSSTTWPSLGDDVDFWDPV